MSRISRSWGRVGWISVVNLVLILVAVHSMLPPKSLLPGQPTVSPIHQLSWFELLISTLAMALLIIGILTEWAGMQAAAVVNPGVWIGLTVLSFIEVVYNSRSAIAGRGEAGLALWIAVIPLGIIAGITWSLYKPRNPCSKL